MPSLNRFIFIFSITLLATASYQAGLSSAKTTPLHQKQAASPAARAFDAGEYDQVIRLYQAARADGNQTPSQDLSRLALRSYVRLGRPEDAWPLYQQLIPEGSADDLPLLREIAWTVVTSRVRDPLEHVRLAAFTVLAESRAQDVGPLLEDSLLDPSVVIRAKAAEAIGRAKLTSGTGTLMRALDDRAPSVRIAAMTSLGELGVVSVRDRLIEVARRDEGPESVFAAGALIRLGREDMLADVSAAVTYPEPEIRMAALGVLGRLKRPATLSLLTQAVYDPEASVRAFAAGALGEFGQTSGISALTHALADEDPRVRAIAATSAGRLGGPHIRSLLQPLLRDADDFVRASALEGLVRAGDHDAMFTAAHLAKHSAPQVRAAVAQSLAVKDYKQAIPLLEQLLRDPQPQPRLAAARALGHVGVQAAIPALKKALQDSEPAVRITAGGGLLRVIDRGRTRTS
jgi:HEAT repeat protein